jgi:hypothetical protein
MSHIWHGVRFGKRRRHGYCRDARCACSAIITRFQRLIAAICQIN